MSYFLIRFAYAFVPKMSTGKTDNDLTFRADDEMTILHLNEKCFTGVYFSITIFYFAIHEVNFLQIFKKFQVLLPKFRFELIESG